MTDEIDFAIYPDTRDLAFVDGDIGLVRREELVQQRLIVKHLTIQGTWDFDLSFGSPYQDVVFKKAPDLAQIQGMITELVVSTPNVLEIDSLDIEYDRTQRRAKIDYIAHTPFERNVRNVINPEEEIYMISILAGSRSIITR